MMRLMSNSIDFCKQKNKVLAPHSENLNTFGIPFYQVFSPRHIEGQVFMTQSSFALLKDQGLDIHLPGISLRNVPLSFIKLGWNGEPDYSGNFPNTSYYKLMIGNDPCENYQLSLLGASDCLNPQITTGEFAHTKGYKVSSSFLEFLCLTDALSQYVQGRQLDDMDGTLGVHLRYSNDKRADLSDLFARIELLRSTVDINKIILATDSLAGYQKLSHHFSDIPVIVFQELIDLDQIHARNLHALPESDLQRYLKISKIDQIGFAFADIWTLFRTEYFIGCNSEFSRLVGTLRSFPDQHLVESFFLPHTHK